MNCKNCNTDIQLNYCPKCGLPATLKRIDGRYIIHELQHVLHFEKGILYTIREMIVRPGQNIRHFISEDRSRLVKPLFFLTITSLIFTIVSHFFNLDDNYQSQMTEIKKMKATFVIVTWIQEHYAYSNLILGAFVALWTKLFFIKHNYNFYEILILMCFVMGMGMLVLSITGIIQGITRIDFTVFEMLIGVIYCSWAIGQFFQKNKLISYVKAFFAYILGSITFFMLAVFIGIILDIIFNNVSH